MTEPIEERLSLKRKYIQSPLSSPRRPTLEHGESFSSNFEEHGLVWTSDHWSKLEKWYIQKDRDYLKAAEAFHRFECRGNGEHWTLELVTWKSKCLDTNARAYNGVLPSQRKKKRRKGDSFKIPQGAPNYTPQHTLNRTPYRTPNLTPNLFPNRTLNRTLNPNGSPNGTPPNDIPNITQTGNSRSMNISSPLRS